MKAGEAGESLLISALNACRARLKAFIRGRTAVRDDVDDILQEVTWQLMKVEQPVENVAAWLFRAARNEMIDRARKKHEVSLPGYLTADDEDFPEQEIQKRYSAYRKRRRKSISTFCYGKSWGKPCRNCRHLSARCLKKRNLRATA